MNPEQLETKKIKKEKRKPKESKKMSMVMAIEN